MFNSAIWLIIIFILLMFQLLPFIVKVCRKKLICSLNKKMFFQYFVKKAITPIKFEVFWKQSALKQSVFPFILSEIPSSFLTGGVNG